MKERSMKGLKGKMRAKDKRPKSNYETNHKEKKGQAKLSSAGERRTGSGGEDTEQ